MIVPRYAGVLSALGMLLADVTKDYSATVLCRDDQETLENLGALFEPLLRKAESDLSAEGFAADAIQLDRAADVRYVGQSYEITVPFSPRFR